MYLVEVKTRNGKVLFKKLFENRQQAIEKYEYIKQRMSEHFTSYEEEETVYSFKGFYSDRPHLLDSILWLHQVVNPNPLKKEI